MNVSEPGAGTGTASRPYRQLARAEGRDHTRAALLDVAEREFFAGRFDGASLEELAAGPGVTKQTLLRHFGSKERLLEQSALPGRERVRRFSLGAGGIAGVVDNLLDYYERDAERALRIAALEGRGGAFDDIVRDAKHLHHDWVHRAFGRWLEPFSARVHARRRAALIVLYDVRAWWVLAHDLGLSRREVRATMIDATERILKARER